MSTLKTRHNIKNSSGGYDTIHQETSADVVIDASGGNIQQTVDNIKANVAAVEITAQEAKSIAEGRSRAEAFSNYAAAISALNAAPANTFQTGDAILIATQNVPDMWIYSVQGSSAAYTYTTDAALLADFAANTTLQMGYFMVAESDSEKIDLSGYVPTSRTVNSKPLTGNISLTATDVSAIPVAEKGTSSGVATLDAAGKVPAAQLPAMDYDPIGSAAAVQSNLSAHTGNTSNPHNTTAAQVGADPIGSAAVVQSNLTAHGSLTAAHGAESGAVPNRIILRDASGRAQIAAPSAAEDIATKGYVDENAGGISAEVAAKYGLSGASATSNNAFDLLSFTQMYAWRHTPRPYILEVGTHANTQITTGTLQTPYMVTNDAVYYTDTISVNQSTGALVPGTITTIAKGSVYLGTAAMPFNVLKGKYWSLSSTLTGTVYYTLPGAADQVAAGASPYAVTIYAATVATIRGFGTPEVLYSTNPNAYPKESTAADEYLFYGLFRDLYINLGVVTGTYTGNGAATRKLTLGFQPRAILVWAVSGGYSGAAGWKHENGLALLGAAATAVTIDNDGITVFYTANTKMTNASGSIYNWVAWR